jgi:hypothetical protein
VPHSENSETHQPSDKTKMEPKLNLANLEAKTINQMMF